jgi:hypothetical protein
MNLPAKPVNHGDMANNKAMLFAFVSRAFSPCRRVAVVKGLSHAA